MLFRKGTKKNFDVVLAAIAASEVRIMVCLSVRNRFHLFAISVRNEFICSKMVIFCYISKLLVVTKEVVKDSDFVLAVIAALEVKMLSWSFICL